MEKDYIFFDSKGLTSTSANHIANKAKELYAKEETSLQELSFLKESLSIIGSINSKLFKKEITLADFNKIPDKINRIAQCKSLIAWLREAIKAKSRLSQEVTEITLEEYCKLINQTYPRYPEPQHILTEDEYYASLPIKERNTYYQLETKCATLGKYIHQDGILSNNRKRFLKANNTVDVYSGSGRDTVLISYDSELTIEQIDKQFFELQELHRSYQANLNSLKFRCESAIKESESESLTKYEKELKLHNTIVNNLQSELATYKNNKLKEIQNLKIVIPDSLKDIYEEVDKL